MLDFDLMSLFEATQGTDEKEFRNPLIEFHNFSVIVYVQREILYVFNLLRFNSPIIVSIMYHKFVSQFKEKKNFIRL